MDYCKICGKPVGKQITSGAIFSYCSLPCEAYAGRYITLILTLVFIIWLSLSPDIIPVIGSLLFSFLAIYGLSVKINKVVFSEFDSFNKQQLSETGNLPTSNEEKIICQGCHAELTMNDKNCYRCGKSTDEELLKYYEKKYN